MSLMLNAQGEAFAQSPYVIRLGKFNQKGSYTKLCLQTSAEMPFEAYIVM